MPDKDKKIMNKTIRMDASMIEKIQKQAEKDIRSFSQQVCYIIEKHLKESEK
jgi:hypothetical protein